MKKDLRQRGEHEWTMILGIFLLLPVFPALPGIIAGRFLMKIERIQLIEDKPLWAGAIVTAAVGVVFYLLIVFGVVTSVFLSVPLILPIVASGFPAGIIFERRTDRRWLAFLPLFIASIAVIIAFVISMVFIYSPGGPR